MPEANDEWHRASSDHLREVPDPREAIGHQRIEVLESYLIGRFGESVLSVRDERRECALQLAHLVDGEGDEDPAATNNDCKQTEEDHRGRSCSRKREPALQECDHGEQDIGKHTSPHERADYVSGPVDDVERSQGEQSDNDALGRAAPTGSHGCSWIIRPGLAAMGSDRWLPRYLKWLRLVAKKNVLGPNCHVVAEPLLR